MYGEARRGHGVGAAFVVAVVTLMALAWPVGAPLYAQVYPGADASTIEEAITNANLDASFASEPITQFETATFRATLIYGTTSPNPDLPTVKIAWSNEAALAAQAEGIFDIKPTSASRQFLDAGTRRPNGGYELTWTWDVTPLVAGNQTLTVSILPMVVVEGEVVPDLLDINKPIPVTVDVHPVQYDFEQVLTAAADMKTQVPGEVIVGEEFEVSASMSLAGHANTVSADIDLERSEHSAAVTIVEEPISLAASRMVLVASSEDDIVRKWTVTSDEPGQVALVATATVRGQAAAHGLERKVPKTLSARATERGPSVWDILQRPVDYIASFVALALAVLGLWAAWKKLKSAGVDSDDHHATGSSGDPTS
ncbi:hypothetical protein [Arthrobacter sp. Z4-13]